LAANARQKAVRGRFLGKLRGVRSGLAVEVLIEKDLALPESDIREEGVSPLSPLHTSGTQLLRNHHIHAG
jgi:hypothetical protein